MAIELLEFTRDWRVDDRDNEVGFSTFRDDEEGVRADMQYLHEETKNYINNVLIPSLKADGLPFNRSSAIPADTIQEALENLQQQIVDAVVEGVLPENAVTTDKVKDGAITSAKLADGAVTASKIGSGAVTAGKIGSGAVTTAKLGAGAVTTEKLANGAVDLTTKVSGILPVANGGTGVANLIDLWAALATLGTYNAKHLPQSAGGTGGGDMLTAVLTALATMNNTKVLNLGDGKIGKIILTSDSYGATLPSSGVEGQLFFKKV